MTTTRATDLLRGAGLRVTAPRRLVLEALARQPHSGTTAVIAAVREAGADISVQGVYDVLAALTSAGLLRQVKAPHSPTRYEVDTGDNHHHLACRGCGDLFDVPCVEAFAPCLTPVHDHGFAIDEADIVFWGLCASCRRAPAPGPDPTHTTGESR